MAFSSGERMGLHPPQTPSCPTHPAGICLAGISELGSFRIVKTGELIMLVCATLHPRMGVEIPLVKWVLEPSVRKPVPVLWPSFPSLSLTQTWSLQCSEHFICYVSDSQIHGQLLSVFSSDVFTLEKVDGGVLRAESQHDSDLSKEASSQRQLAIRAPRVDFVHVVPPDQAQMEGALSLTYLLSFKLD